MMKKFVAGVIIGILLCYAGLAVASSPQIRLIINGQEINTDVPPQLIDGRVLVPARFVAEPLGAQVQWDAEKNAVVINSTSPATDGTLLFDSGWVRLRDVAPNKGWIVSGDGYVYRNQLDYGKRIPLFNWRDSSKIINGTIYIPKSLADM
ncbi:MAG TPA: copper amine oxidase N-terminal domain-containing protein [Dissulfurispiraceae bacterium]|nr:copper amine oxidase N-terminal domain-containing protein [Dissulfurispiraceae bacterium]